MPRIALVTTPAATGLDPDEQPLRSALAAAGADVAMAPWRDPAVDWSSFDLVVLRSPWDYVEHLDEFLAWLRRVEAVAPLRNPGGLVTWNLDKRYLRELADAGVPVIPTTWLAPGDTWTWPGPGPGPGSGDLVVKPVVGAGSRDLAVYRADDPGHRVAAEAHVARLLGAGRAVMVQPCLRSIAEQGEWPMVYVEGRFSHTASKRVPVPEGSVTAEFFVMEQMAEATATPDMIAVADAAMALVSARFGTPLYGRVDLVRDDDGALRVLEVELAEPSLFLPQAPGAAAPMAEAFVRAARPEPSAVPGR